MKIILTILLIFNILFFCGNSLAYLYSNLEGQQTLDLENGEFYFESSSMFWGGTKLKINTPNGIYSYNFATQTLREVYQAESQVISLQYLPKSGLLSFRTLKDFHVINRAGVKVDGFILENEDGILSEYVWNQDENRIAYRVIKEMQIDIDGRTAFKTTGIWIYDFKTKERWKVADEGYYLGGDVNRDVFYFRLEGNTYRCDFATGEVKPYPYISSTMQQAMYCSPDQKLCAYETTFLFEDSFDPTIGIYDNEEKREWSPEELDFFIGRNIHEYVWGRSSKYIAVKGRSEKGSRSASIFIYNLEDKKTVERIDIDGRIYGISSDRSTICIYDDDKGTFFLKKFPRK